MIGPRKYCESLEKVNYAPLLKVPKAPVIKPLLNPAFDIPVLVLPPRATSSYNKMIPKMLEEHARELREDLRQRMI